MEDFQRFSETFNRFQRELLLEARKLQDAFQSMLKIDRIINQTSNLNIANFALQSNTCAYISSEARFPVQRSNTCQQESAYPYSLIEPIYGQNKVDRSGCLDRDRGV